MCRTDWRADSGCLFHHGRDTRHDEVPADAARLAASVAYARLHTSERFLEQMKKGRAEYQALKDNQQSAVHTVESTPTARTNSRANTLQGLPATDSANGIVIQNQQKVVRK